MKRNTLAIAVLTLLAPVAWAAPPVQVAQMAAQPAEHGAVVSTQKHSMARPDNWISSNLKSSLAHSNAVDASGINVSVADGAVFLQGTVKDAAQIQVATDLAVHTTGVKSVDATGLSVEHMPPVQ